MKCEEGKREEGRAWEGVRLGEMRERKHGKRMKMEQDAGKRRRKDREGRKRWKRTEGRTGGSKVG